MENVIIFIFLRNHSNENILISIVWFQLGYIPGKGLGKKNQGIVRPVEATMHKGKGSIGHGRPAAAAILSDDEVDEEEIARKLGEPEQKKGISKWKKTDVSGNEEMM